MKRNGFIKRFAVTALLALSAATGVFAQGGGGSKQVLVGGTDFDPSVPAVGKAYVGTNEIKMIGIFGGEVTLYGILTMIIVSRLQIKESVLNRISMTVSLWQLPETLFS